MDSILNIFKEFVNLLKEDKLVFSIISDELNEENVGLLEDTEIGTRALSLIQILLSHDDHGDLVGLQVSEKPLVLLIGFLLISDDLGVIVLPVGNHLADIIQHGCLRFSTPDLPHLASALNESGHLIAGDRLAQLNCISEVIGALRFLDAEVGKHVETLHEVA